MKIRNIIVAIGIILVSINICFATNEIKIKNKQVKEENKIYRYNIDIEYPEIILLDKLKSSKLNHAIKKLMYERYKPYVRKIKPVKKMLERYPGYCDTIHITYEILFSNSELLSIRFEEYTYNFTASPSQTSLVINYNLKKGALIKLDDIFRPNSNYLKVIMEECDKQFMKKTNSSIDSIRYWRDFLYKTNRYNRWNFTKEGLVFHFDKCEIVSCSQGYQKVIINYGLLKDFISNKSPLANLECLEDKFFLAQEKDLF